MQGRARCSLKSKLSECAVCVYILPVYSTATVSLTTYTHTHTPLVPAAAAVRAPHSISMRRPVTCCGCSRWRMPTAEELVPRAGLLCAAESEFAGRCANLFGMMDARRRCEDPPADLCDDPEAPFRAASLPCALKGVLLRGVGLRWSNLSIQEEAALVFAAAACDADGDGGVSEANSDLPLVVDCFFWSSWTDGSIGDLGDGKSGNDKLSVSALLGCLPCCSLSSCCCCHCRGKRFVLTRFRGTTGPLKAK